jgi:DNA-binding PadR family transcriptional regulator
MNREEIDCPNHMTFHHHRHNWLRHNAMVPKGFLRHQVLSALKEKPMSGSELMEEISKNTGGHWKPSPGSIYPMLAWLQDNTYIEELSHENGLKRYELTSGGKELLEEESKVREKFGEEAGFMTFPFFDRTQSNIPKEQAMEIRMTMKRLLHASINVGKTLRENYSEADLKETLKILDEASEKLETINFKLKGAKA